MSEPRNPTADARRPTDGRRYESALRRSQATRTRTSIIEAFVEQLAQAPVDALSVPQAAARAGTSIRTVYHYFPNQEAQIEAVAAWLERQIVGEEEEPRSADDLPDLARALYRAFGEHETLVRAQAGPGISRLIRRIRREQRLAAIDQALAAAGGEPQQTRWAAALIKHLCGADAGIALKDEFGLLPEEAGEAVAWAVELLTQALRSRD